MNRISFVSWQLAIGTFCCLYTRAATAQVTSDGTVNTQVSQNGNVAEITGGETRQGNLFHSFQDFSVSPGNEAFFDNSADINNIFSRVTGGNISNINGAISANGTANLFLINPAGIIFGENASLNFGGSFYGSTASSILFEDGEFSAVDNIGQPILTVNAPIGLGFRDEPGAIVNQASGSGLEVASGNNIALLGGDVSFDGGKLFAPGGQVTVGGLVSSGQVELDSDNSFTFPEDANQSDLAFANQSEVNVSSAGGGLINLAANNLEIAGESLILANIDEGQGAADAVAGSIIINANSLVGRQESFIQSDNLGIGSAGTIEINVDTLDFAGEAAITASTFGQGDAGDINVVAQDIIIDGEFSGIYSNVGLTPFAPESLELDIAGVNGNGGVVNIDTNNLELTAGARIISTSIAQGDGGDININATGDVSYIGQGTTPVPAFSDGPVISGSFSQVQQEGNGNAGSVSITADSLTLIDKGAVLTDNSGAGGDAGDINLNIANNIFLDQVALILAQVQGGAVGNGGDINISAGSIEAQGGSFILADTKGQGNAGNINIDVAGAFSLDSGTRILTEVQEEAIGDAGDIIINAGALSLDNESSIGSQTVGQGDAGNIEITTNSLALDNESELNTQTLGMGNAGSIMINAVENVALSNESAITSRVDNVEVREDEQEESGSETLNNIAEGDAGDILIETGELTLNDSELSNTSFARGDAGDITVNATGRVFLDQGSQFNSDVNDLSSGAFDAVGNAGIIRVSAREVTLLDNSTLQSSTSGQGNAGGVFINAQDNVTFDGNFSGILSQVRGEGVGNGGNISVTAGNSILINDQSIILANSSDQARGNAGSVAFSAGNTFSVNESLVLSQVEGEAVGNGGEISIDANNIDITNFSLVSTNARQESSGPAGNVNFKGGNISVNSGAVVDALTEGDFNGGSITFTGANLEIASGGVVVTSTASGGNAGNIDLDITERIVINGAGTIPRPESVFEISEQTLIDLQEATGLFSNSSPGATGSGGTLLVKANALDIEQGTISATTESGSGGNIDLTVDETITLRNNSLISAQAANQANGGNININTEFIVAFPNQVEGNGSDIVANAAQGQGGEITIGAQSLLGIEEQPAINDNRTNDIDATSDESSLDGSVTINTSDINPVRGVTELPSNVVEPGETTQQACQASQNANAPSRFSVQGQGGIAPTPDSSLGSESIFVGGNPVVAESPVPKAIETAQGRIQLARGITTDESGRVTLTAYRTDNAGERIYPGSKNCGQV